jgi:hypothetical protein
MAADGAAVAGTGVAAAAVAGAAVDTAVGAEVGGFVAAVDEQAETANAVTATEMNMNCFIVWCSLRSWPPSTTGAGGLLTSGSI